MAIIAFFTPMLLCLFVIYAVDPSIYLQSLKLAPSPANRFPWPATLFLICLVAFLGVLSVGVLRHWRWTFWLILSAFSASVLQFPAELCSADLPGCDGAVIFYSTVVIIQ